MVIIVAIVIGITLLLTLKLRPVYTARDAMADRRAKRYLDNDTKHFR